MSALLLQFWPYIAAAGAALIGIWRLYATGKSAGINQEKAKEAAARERDLDAIKRAAGARPSGSVEDDPNNRDRI